MKQHLLYLRTRLPIHFTNISLYFWVLSDKSAQALEAWRAFDMFKNVIAWVSMLYLGVTFGLSFSIIKIILQTIDNPIWVLFWQSSISSILLLALAIISKTDLSGIRCNFGALALLSGFGVIVPNIALYLSAAHISVGSISILLAFVPFALSLFQFNFHALFAQNKLLWLINV